MIRKRGRTWRVLQGTEKGLGFIVTTLKKNWKSSRGVIGSDLHFRNISLTAVAEKGCGRKKTGD